MLTNWHKPVAERNKRKQHRDIAKLWLGKETMSKQAKVLNAVEIRRVLDYVATRKHSERNRAIITMMFNTGMRVSEVSSLRYHQVVDSEGKVRSEIRLKAEDTKTKDSRLVFVNEKLRKELERYIRGYNVVDMNTKFFYSQKRDSDGFSANTLTQMLFHLYRKVGLNGVSSHSSRRTFITNLANRGIGVRTIMGLSGHKALSSVQVYIDCNEELMRQACELA